MNEGARADAVVHLVVDQPHQSAHGQPMTRGPQVHLICDRALVIADLIAHIGEDLDQSHTEIGFMSLCPGRLKRGNEVEKRAPEARVVLCEVVDIRIDSGERWTICAWPAIEMGWAPG